ncbi:hypothetical protein ACFQS7_16700 [Dankookia sp. GCM10030260]|uniref:hypothetical protein n=1 Tax=Dankookia sp. GCM10030260 TaxID=3273390 RepID=UPI0036236010
MSAVPAGVASWTRKGGCVADLPADLVVPVPPARLASRSMVPKPPGGLVVDESFPAREENGLTIVDATPEDMTLRDFTWRHAAPEAIDPLAPVRIIRLARA